MKKEVETVGSTSAALGAFSAKIGLGKSGPRRQPRVMMLKEVLKARTTACQPEQRACRCRGECAKKGLNQGALITQPPAVNQTSSADATKMERKGKTAASGVRRGKVIGAEVQRVESILRRKSVSAVEDQRQLN